MTIKFKDPVNRKNLIKVKSPAGSHFRPVVKWRVDDEGELVRKVTEVENVYDKIQAGRDSVDIHKILERYENGDASALERVQGMYIDTADLPKNFHQLYQAVQVHNDTFNSMPAEIKEKFDNSPAKFWKEFGTERFDNVINEYRQTVYSNYAMEDPNPVKTVTEVDIKEGENNEQKSE